MNILVTGGAGYIGSNTVKKLIQEGYHPIIIDNLSTGFNQLINTRAVFIRGNINDAKLLNQLFTTHKITAVMHFAALSKVGDSFKQSKQYFANNCEGSRILFECMIKNRVKNLIFSSSAAIFGNHPTPISEETAQNPLNPYGETKQQTEILLKEFDHTHQLKSISLRYFNVSGTDADNQYGELHDPPTHLIPIALKAIQNKQPFTIFGTNYNTPDGSCIRDYIHVEDLVAAHILALKQLLKSQQSDQFNLGSESGHSVREVLEACQKMSSFPLEILSGPRRKGDPAILIANSTKSKHVLNWKPTKTLANMISDSWKWIQKQNH